MENDKLCGMDDIGKSVKSGINFMGFMERCSRCGDLSLESMNNMCGDCNHMLSNCQTITEQLG